MQTTKHIPRLRIIVGGFIGLLPAGGVTWDYVQYPLGFHLMGHDVYYIEDTRLYPIYQQAGSQWDDASSCVQHLQQVMTYFGMQDRWAYRDEASGRSFGLTEQQIRELCATADLFVNISCSTFLRDEYRNIPVRILIDSDPMFTQIQYASQQMFTPGVSGIKEMIEGHNFHFTFGENYGAPDCLIPRSSIRWLPTRQPVCLQYWEAAPLPGPSAPFTTLMNWSAAKKLVFDGQEWGQKEIEFQKIMELPKLLPSVCLALGIGQTGAVHTIPKTELLDHGWQLLDPEQVAGNWEQYLGFIRESAGEFSVAKETYVKAQTGWFSCRSACYLASARPVVVQETGWSNYIPSGRGALAFTDRESAVAALEEVQGNRQQHALWARELAEAYFDSHKVLQSVLDQID